MYKLVIATALGQVETTKAKWAARQLPVFPELPGGDYSYLEYIFLLQEPCSRWVSVDMVGIGFAHMPPIEHLVASYLRPSQKSSMTLTGPTLPTKYERFQSSVTEVVHRSVATAVRVLSTASMFSAYQAELQEELYTLEPGLWDEIFIATDLNLHLLKAAVQASGRAMGLMISQERAQ